MLNCPKCNRIIVDTTHTGGVKVRSRMIVIDETGAHAICPSCKTNVEVPLSMDKSKLPPTNKLKHVIHS